MKTKFKIGDIVVISPNSPNYNFFVKELQKKTNTIFEVIGFEHALLYRKAFLIKIEPVEEHLKREWNFVMVEPEDICYAPEKNNQ